jgi:hypothetical protein
MVYSTLEDRQLGAMARATRLGRTLQEDHPEMASLYRSGVSLIKLVERLEIESEYHVSHSIARSGVYSALVGHNGEGNIPSYKGLVTKKEIKEIGLEHKREAGREGVKVKRGIHARSAAQVKRDAGYAGRRAYLLGRGTHGFNAQQRKEWQKKGAHAGGAATYEMKRGIHGLSRRQMRNNCLKALANRGVTGWSYEERRQAYLFSRQPQYRSGSGSDNELVAQAVNDKYHGGKMIRTPRAVKEILFRYRKSLRNKKDRKI